MDEPRPKPRNRSPGGGAGRLPFDPIEAVRHVSAKDARLGTLIERVGPFRRLRAAGLSRGKIAALRDLATKTIDGTVPQMRELRKLSDDEIVERLSAVRGIGVEER